MQAYKLKGTIDHSGHLVINDPIAIPPGEVEVIVLQPLEIKDKEIRSFSEQSNPNTSAKTFRTKIKAFQDLFENTQPAPPDFDPDQARWEALKAKHNL